MKIVKINESQRCRLFEAYRDGFNFETLSWLGSTWSGRDNWESQYNYCEKWLGHPFAFGSSRCVFTLNDSIVLKLAMGGNWKAGVEQNRIEYEIYQRYKSPLMATVFDCDDNFTYLVSENVLPCEADDFKEILGIPFYESENGSNISVNSLLEYITSNYAFDEPMFDMRLEQMVNTNPWFREVKKLVEKTKMCDLNDAVGNFGLVNRDGKPSIVILDGGYNMEIYEKYYS